jgi:hypothetical protein
MLFALVPINGLRVSGEEGARVQDCVSPAGAHRCEAGCQRHAPRVDTPPTTSSAGDRRHWSRERRAKCAPVPPSLTLMHERCLVLLARYRAVPA